MGTRKPEQPNKQNEEVYEWIAHLQSAPEDEAVKEKMILTYQNLVESIARKYSKNSSIHEDLSQVGMIGLLSAVKRYDPSFGRTFESFAIPTIIGEIKRYMRDKTWSVHVPRRIKELGPKIKKSIEELTTSDQESPTVKEIANYLDIPEEEILETMEMGKSYQALSVDRKIEADSEGGTVSILDLIGNKEEGYEKVDVKLLLEKALPVLTERERAIITYTYFENKSQKETGEIIGISQMHVSRIQRQSLVKLKEALETDQVEML